MEKIDFKNIGDSFFKTKNHNKKIEKIIYNQNTNEIFLNESLYFVNVTPEVWRYKIGGYQVLDKYLKSHKNEELDCEYFKTIIQKLHKTLEIQSQISRCEW